MLWSCKKPPWYQQDGLRFDIKKPDREGGETRSGWEVSYLLIHYNNIIATVCNDVKRCAIVCKADL